MHEKQQSNSIEWYTPKEIFEELRFPEFDLDPASPGADKVPWLPAKKHYTKSDNGLRLPWTGFVWLNPPFGRKHNVTRWLEKMENHRNGIVLLPARTETDWFQYYCRRADAVAFRWGRINFVDENMKRQKGNVIGSAFFAFGKIAKTCLEFSPYSIFVEVCKAGGRSAR